MGRSAMLLGRRAVGAVAVAAGLAAFSGCQNKMYEENKALHEQNRVLQGRLDERAAMQPVAPEPKIAEPTPPPPPEPAKPPQVGTKAMVPPTPPPTDLGGETTIDDAAGTTTVNFLGDALFDSGKATVKDSAKTNLDKLIAALKSQYAGKPVQVQGHSDSDPIRVSKWKSNQELSEARAKAVRDYLVKKGVESGRVTAEGFGDSKPKGSDKSKNRRVEIVVMTK